MTELFGFNLVWWLFGVITFSLLVLDLGVFNKKDHVIGIKESLYTSLFYISIGLLFPFCFYWVYPE